MSETRADCFLAPFTKVSMVVSGCGMFGFDDRAEGAERVEALAARVLAIEPLEIAGGDVVEARIAGDVGLDVFRRAWDASSGGR